MIGLRRSSLPTLWTAIRLTVLLTVLLGLAYPLAVTGVGQLVFPRQANGSIVRTADGRPAGSALIGQSFTDTEGRPLPRYFQPRPSAAGNGYDARSSSGSNWGPNNDQLIAAIGRRRAEIAEFNDVPTENVPADAVTASGSGLDPDISPAYARIQIGRVAAARGLPEQQVAAVVEAATRRPLLGYLGQPRVNVVELNLELDRTKVRR